jgi:hypothetical protein
MPALAWSIMHDVQPKNARAQPTLGCVIASCVAANVLLIVLPSIRQPGASLYDMSSAAGGGRRRWEARALYRRCALLAVAPAMGIDQKAHSLLASPRGAFVYEKRKGDPTVLDVSFRVRSNGHAPSRVGRG